MATEPVENGVSTPAMELNRAMRMASSFGGQPKTLPAAKKGPAKATTWLDMDENKYMEKKYAKARDSVQASGDDSCSDCDSELPIQSVTPRADSCSASVINDASQKNVSHALWFLTTSSQASTSKSVRTTIAMNATTVASMPKYGEPTHRTRQASSVPQSLSSLGETWPISRCCRRISRDSCVKLTRGRRNRRSAGGRINRSSKVGTLAPITQSANPKSMPKMLVALLATIGLPAIPVINSDEDSRLAVDATMTKKPPVGFSPPSTSMSSEAITESTMGYTIPPPRAVFDGMNGASASSARHTA
ncbi:hypothetical protein IWW57_004885 [Coemansia sp. S610]|nr:hypothetical protein IWW57_004885 [Coemansia sp. S610]